MSDIQEGATESSGFDTAHMDMTNFNAAHAELKMTPEEQALYRHHLERVEGDKGVTNDDGSRSTVKQMNLQVGDKFHNVPTVWDGKALDWDKPEERAQIVANVQKAGGWDKFPAYKSAEEAEARYEAMHKHMERDIR